MRYQAHRRRPRFFNALPVTSYTSNRFGRGACRRRLLRGFLFAVSRQYQSLEQTIVEHIRCA